MNRDLLYSQTYTGKKFHYFNAVPEEIDIVDIAHALGKQCRFNGHCKKYYSVAEHSYWASKLVSPDQALEALLHDASEAYIGDIPKPFKIGISDIIHPLEDGIIKMVFEKYGAGPFPLSKEVKAVDFEMLYWERDMIMGNKENEWECFEGVSFDEDRRPDLQYWDHDEAKSQFLLRFEELMSERQQ